ncbi:hypothetical protein FQN57_004112 [Myotisia sp. PD_48]|nr:hypothetical protein FQN57_004112 [Myotisia sp. PD_48]
MAETNKRKRTPGTRFSTTTFTSRNPPWAYLHLQLITTSPNSPLSTPNTLDPLTAKTNLTAALSQFLGVSGTAIPIDILTIEDDGSVWIRVPFGDAHAVTAAVSSWIGSASSASSSAGSVAWKIRARGAFLGALVGGTGRELFVP